jgi:putative Holliday junction resolvase
MGRILAIDFGLKRTGLAITDASKSIAFPHKTIDSRELINEINRLNLQESIETIVLGEPKKMDTSDTHISENVRLLHLELQRQFSSMQVVLHDERFTSGMAAASIHQMGLKKSKRQEKELVDMVSATIILQSYLQQNFVKRN